MSPRPRFRTRVQSTPMRAPRRVGGSRPRAGGGAGRAGCPFEADVLGEAPLVTFRLPGHIGRRPATVTASSSRPFTGGGFAGTVDATVTLAVRRVPLKR
jgi:hypothetical protein